MILKFLQMFLVYIVCIFAVEELIFPVRPGSQEMIEQGRIQYQVNNSSFR